MGQYRKKPVVIEAVQFVQNHADEAEFAEHDIPDWLLDAMAAPPGEVGSIWVEERRRSRLVIGTLEGFMTCAPLDFIIRGVKGEIYPCKPDIFAATYEAVE